MIRPPHADVWGAQIARRRCRNGDLSASARNQPKLVRVQHWLLKLMRDEQLPVTERALAATISRAGRSALRCRHWHLPANRCSLHRIPPVIQDGDDLHRVSLPHYYLARWP